MVSFSPSVHSITQHSVKSVPSPCFQRLVQAVFLTMNPRSEIKLVILAHWSRGILHAPTEGTQDLLTRSNAIITKSKNRPADVSPTKGVPGEPTQHVEA